MRKMEAVLVAMALSATACGGQVTGVADRVADDAATDAPTTDGASATTDAGATEDAATSLAECDADVRMDPIRACHVGEQCRLDTPHCSYIATCIDAGWLTECVDGCPPMSGDPPAEGTSCKTRGLACRFGPIPCDETDCTCTSRGGALVWECVTSHCR